MYTKYASTIVARRWEVKGKWIDVFGVAKRTV